jgi:hypothetical protein
VAGGLRFTPNPRAKQQLLGELGMKALVSEVASDAASRAARHAPRNTGRLAASIDSSVEKDGGEWVGVTFVGEWYGKLWEFGHRGRSQPFLRPGMQAALTRYGGRFKSK